MAEKKTSTKAILSKANKKQASNESRVAELKFKGDIADIRLRAAEDIAVIRGKSNLNAEKRKFQKENKAALAYAKKVKAGDKPKKK
jgi:hypothetical protein